MPAGGGKGEEVNVPADMPPAAQALYPFVALVDGLLGVEATATLKRIAIPWPQSGGNPNHRRGVTSRVGLPSL